MTKPMTAHRIMPVLTLLVLVPIGAFAQSDSASRPPVRAAAADKQAGEKPGEGSRAAHSDSSYMISADDVLAINVWKEPEVSRSGPVRSDGKISLPLVGELTAGGQTPLQLEQEITKRLPARRSWQCDGRLPRGEAVEPDARIEDGPGCEVGTQRQGKEAKLSCNGNLLVENRNGLIVNTEVFEANGTAECDAALVLLEQIPGTKQVTVGGDKAYHTADFVAECRNLKVTPHVAQNRSKSHHSFFRSLLVGITASAHSSGQTFES